MGGEPGPKIMIQVLRTIKQFIMEEYCLICYIKSKIMIQVLRTINQFIIEEYCLICYIYIGKVRESERKTHGNFMKILASFVPFQRMATLWKSLLPSSLDQLAGTFALLVGL
jgi:hypothetical protein